MTCYENVTLLGLEVDSKLNLLYPIYVNSFIFANFTYCPLVWHFSSRESINKIKNMQKRTLRFILNDYSWDYETLSKKTNKCTMEVKRPRLLALDIFKAFNEDCPTFIKDYFEKDKNSVWKKYDLKIPIQKSVTFGDNSLRPLAPHVWNSVLKHHKLKLLI